MMVCTQLRVQRPLSRRAFAYCRSASTAADTETARGNHRRQTKRSLTTILESARYRRLIGDSSVCPGLLPQPPKRSVLSVTPVERPSGMFAHGAICSAQRRCCTRSLVVPCGFSFGEQSSVFSHERGTRSGRPFCRTCEWPDNTTPESVQRDNLVMAGIGFRNACPLLRWKRLRI